MSRYVLEQPTPTIDGLVTLLERAQTELSALCRGKRFRMSVPVDDEDSDMVIGDALRHATAFVKAFKQYGAAASDPPPQDLTAKD